jgi:ubiquinone/menaquinone biosynthesis C-methylase UbiE
MVDSDHWMCMIYRFQARQLGNPNSLFARVFAPVWNRRNAALNDTVFAQLELQSDDRVLEVGFGGGYLLKRIAPVLVGGYLAGVDVSRVMVTRNVKQFRQLIESGKLDLRCASAEKLPYPTEDFTKACTVNSIFYWQDASQALAELYRVLKSNGKIFLCQTSASSLGHKGFASYVARYEAQDIQQLLERAGFQDIAILNTTDQYRGFFCLSAIKLPPL